MPPKGESRFTAAAPDFVARFIYQLTEGEVIINGPEEIVHFRKLVDEFKKICDPVENPDLPPQIHDCWNCFNYEIVRENAIYRLLQVPNVTELAKKYHTDRTGRHKHHPLGVRILESLSGLRQLNQNNLNLAKIVFGYVGSIAFVLTTLNPTGQAKEIYDVVTHLQQVMNLIFDQTDIKRLFSPNIQVTLRELNTQVLPHYIANHTPISDIIPKAMAALAQNTQQIATLLTEIVFILTEGGREKKLPMSLHEISRYPHNKQNPFAQMFLHVAEFVEALDQPARRFPFDALRPPEQSAVMDFIAGNMESGVGPRDFRRATHPVHATLLQAVDPTKTGREMVHWAANTDVTTAAQSTDIMSTLAKWLERFLFSAHAARDANFILTFRGQQFFINVKGANFLKAFLQQLSVYANELEQDANKIKLQLGERSRDAENEYEHNVLGKFEQLIRATRDVQKHSITPLQNIDGILKALSKIESAIIENHFADMEQALLRDGFFTDFFSALGDNPSSLLEDGAARPAASSAAHSTPMRRSTRTITTSRHPRRVEELEGSDDDDERTHHRAPSAPRNVTPSPARLLAAAASAGSPQASQPRTPAARQGTPQRSRPELEGSDDDERAHHRAPSAPRNVTPSPTRLLAAAASAGSPQASQPRTPAARQGTPQRSRPSSAVAPVVAPPADRGTPLQDLSRRASPTRSDDPGTDDMEMQQTFAAVHLPDGVPAFRLGQQPPAAQIPRPSPRKPSSKTSWFTPFKLIVGALLAFGIVAILACTGAFPIIPAALLVLGVVGGGFALAGIVAAGVLLIGLAIKTIIDINAQSGAGPRPDPLHRLHPEESLGAAAAMTSAQSSRHNRGSSSYGVLVSPLTIRSDDDAFAVSSDDDTPEPRRATVVAANDSRVEEVVTPPVQSMVTDRLILLRESYQVSLINQMTASTPKFNFDQFAREPDVFIQLWSAILAPTGFTGTLPTTDEEKIAAISAAVCKILDRGMVSEEHGLTSKIKQTLLSHFKPRVASHSVFGAPTPIGAAAGSALAAAAAPR